MNNNKTDSQHFPYTDYEEWKGWLGSAFGACSTADSAYFSAELINAGISNCSGLRIYEIGFGNGSFAGYIRSAGGDYFGSELSQILVERATEFGVKVLRDGIKQALEMDMAGSFDLVVAFDVLEHLSIIEIKSFLSDARQLLKSNGVVLARVPSGDSPFGRAIFHGDITHCSSLGSRAIRQIALQTGFNVIKIGPPQLPLLGGGVIRFFRRSCIKVSQIIIAKIINIIFHEGQHHVITSNLVFSLKKQS